MIQRIVQWANWKQSTGEIFSTPMVACEAIQGTLNADNWDVNAQLLSVAPAVVECYLFGGKIYFSRDQALAAETGLRRAKAVAAEKHGLWRPSLGGATKRRKQRAKSRA